MTSTLQLTPTGTPATRPSRKLALMARVIPRRAVTMPVVVDQPPGAGRSVEQPVERFLLEVAPAPGVLQGLRDLLVVEVVGALLADARDAERPADRRRG